MTRFSLLHSQYTIGGLLPQQKRRQQRERTRRPRERAGVHDPRALDPDDPELRVQNRPNGACTRRVVPKHLVHNPLPVHLVVAAAVLVWNTVARRLDGLDGTQWGVDTRKDSPRPFYGVDVRIQVELRLLAVKTC